MFFQLLFVALVAAQDPAQGWTAYAVGHNPNPHSNDFITFASAKWKVGALPTHTGCFYSPWYVCVVLCALTLRPGLASNRATI